MTQEFTHTHTHTTTQAISDSWVPFSEMPQRQAGCQGDVANACPGSLGSSIFQRAHPTGPCSGVLSHLASVIRVHSLGSSSTCHLGGRLPSRTAQIAHIWLTCLLDQLTRTPRQWPQSTPLPSQSPREAQLAQAFCSRWAGPIPEAPQPACPALKTARWRDGQSWGWGPRPTGPQRHGPQVATPAPGSSQNHILNREVSEVDWGANYEAMKKRRKEKTVQLISG